MNKIGFKLGKIISGMALKVTNSNVNSTCLCYAHQPKLPSGAEKLKK